VPWKKRVRFIGHWLELYNWSPTILIRIIKERITCLGTTIRFVSPVWRCLIFGSLSEERNGNCIYVRSLVFFFSHIVCVFFCIGSYFHQQRGLVVYVFDYFTSDFYRIPLRVLKYNNVEINHVITLSKHNNVIFCLIAFYTITLCRLQLKCDGTRWSTGGEVKGKLANAVGSQYPSHYLGTWCIQHYYGWCAHIGCQ